MDEFKNKIRGERKNRKGEKNMVITEPTLIDCIDGAGFFQRRESIYGDVKRVLQHLRRSMEKWHSGGLLTESLTYMAIALLALTAITVFLAKHTK